MRSLYEHAGGEEALHRLEDVFYSKVLADPLLKTVFTERSPDHVDHLTWFTGESFGGPDRFTRELVLSAHHRRAPEAEDHRRAKGAIRHPVH
jgi:hemoglobin